MKTSTRHKNPLGDISVLYVAVMARALRAEGRDPTDLLSRFGLDEQALGAPAARISIPRFMRMGQAAIALTGNPALGLTMGQLSRPVDAGIAGLAAQSAATAGEAISTLIHYSLLNSRNSRGVPGQPARAVKRIFTPSNPTMCLITSWWIRSLQPGPNS